MDYKSDIDELLEWINDSSKVLTKKQKKKINETASNTKESKKKISKEIKDKLNKYNRKSIPPLSERIQIPKEYKNMLKEEETFKNNRMNEIMKCMKTMTEEQQQKYLNELLSNKEIEI